MGLGLLILRLAVGLTVAAHGSQKLFGSFGGGRIGGTAPFMEQLGFRPGRLHSLLAGFGELAGGLLLAVGLLTPVGSAIVVAVMFTAAVSAHLPKGFFAHQGGYEYVFILATAVVAIAFTGPGDYSVDQVIGLSWSGPMGRGRASGGSRARGRFTPQPPLRAAGSIGAGASPLTGGLSNRTLVR